MVRSEEKGARLEALGVRTAIADYNVPATFEGLFTEGDRVLLISSSEMTADRVAQHRVVIDAARSAGVALLAYTSATGGHGTPLAEAHRGTEKVLVASGLPYVLLRNNWYSEIFVDRLETVVERGVLVRAAGEGRLRHSRRLRGRRRRGAHRRGPREPDVRAGRGHRLELPRVRAELGRQTGREIEYTPVTVEAYTDLMVGPGMPELYASILAGAEASFAKGELAGTSGELSRLIGRRAAPIAETVAAALRRG